MIRFRKFIKDLPFDKKRPESALHLVERTGRVYLVEGVEVELFPLEILLEALNRKSCIFYRWEKQGRMPKPIFQVPSVKNKSRWYSAEQVMNLHLLLLRRHKAYWSRSRWFKIEDFFADVKKVFYEDKLVVNEQGHIDIAKGFAPEHHIVKGV